MTRTSNRSSGVWVDLRFVDVDFDRRASSRLMKRRRRIRERANATTERIDYVHRITRARSVVAIVPVVVYNTCKEDCKRVASLTSSRRTPRPTPRRRRRLPRLLPRPPRRRLPPPRRRHRRKSSHRASPSPNTSPPTPRVSPLSPR